MEHKCFHPPQGSELSQSHKCSCALGYDHLSDGFNGSAGDAPEGWVHPVFEETRRVVDPIEVECDVCFSKPGRQCTQPTDTGRRDVNWFHWKRIDKAEEMTG